MTANAIGTHSGLAFLGAYVYAKRQIPYDDTSVAIAAYGLADPKQQFRLSLFEGKLSEKAVC